MQRILFWRTGRKNSTTRKQEGKGGALKLTKMSAERARLTASESIDAIGGRKEGKKEEDGRYNMQCLPAYLPASRTDWLFGSRTQEGKASTVHMHNIS